MSGADTLPLVSVIIVNYNYAKLLRRAYDSVIAQTYPRIQIIIVDDHSSDQSVDLMDALRRENNEILLLKLPENGGQSVASREAFGLAGGAYVVFLDADDILLPRCIETHVYAHMSSRIAVACSSVDIFNNVAGGDVNTSQEGFSTYVQSKVGSKPAALRPIDLAAPDSWFAGRTPPVQPEQIHFVLPPQADPWVWSPASANCYRRDAVAILFEGTPPLHLMRWGTDLYLIKTLSSLFGSILIDKPLMRYMTHGGNSFVKCAPLNKYLVFDTGSTTEHMRLVTRLSIEQLVAMAEQNAHRYENPSAFFASLKSMAESWPGPPAGESASQYLLRLAFSDRGRLERLFGKHEVDWFLASECREAPKRSRFLKTLGLIS